MEPSARSLIAIAVTVALLAVATALGAASNPAPAARSFVNAIFQRNGAVVCRLADPTTKAELLALSHRARNDPTWQGPSDCAHMAQFLIGYPHQNVGLRLVSGRILSFAGV